MLSEGKANGLNTDLKTSTVVLMFREEKRPICDCCTFIIDAAISVLMSCQECLHLFLCHLLTYHKTRARCIKFSKRKQLQGSSSSLLVVSLLGIERTDILSNKKCHQIQIKCYDSKISVGFISKYFTCQLKAQKIHRIFLVMCTLVEKKRA